MMEQILRDILAERVHQDGVWGGADHDDEHDSASWLDFCTSQTKKAWRGVKLDGSRPSDAVVRKRLVKIAALALAGIASIDRRNYRRAR